ncbi:hypothetical protein DY000_02045806 [Brassica cretica]|uniref:Uncharacterized protein n=1 Tax=Brassica cretica TaxID=69181 RepID=A0ABQ7EPR7_BRACR|nr:hypothetical protein DY000_02045806 [Brassica cretica]
MGLQCLPSLRAKIGRPSNIDGPPILKFKGLKGTNNIDINLISVADTDNIRNVFINHVTPTVSDDKVVDKKIDALLQAICKEGGLGIVTWVEHGTKNIQMEKNTGEEVREEVRGEAEEENEKSDDKETSRKRKIKVRIDSTKKLKAPESSVVGTEIRTVDFRLNKETRKTLTSQRTRISANYYTSSNQNTRITTIKYNKSKREQRRSYSEFAYERLQQGISLASRAVGEIPSSSNPKTAKPN